MKMEKMALIFSNFSTPESAQEILRQLMDEKLVTCGNIWAPHYAIYPWDDKIQEEAETGVLFKSPLEKKQQVIDRLREIHPYDLPPIISFDAEATEDYVRWLNDPYNYNKKSL